MSFPPIHFLPPATMIIREEEVEPPHKKKNLAPLPPFLVQPCHTFSSLPVEIAVNCIARISISYYPKLSLVSKTFRFIISSPELYAARSQTGTAEICLYTCLQFSTVHFTPPTRRWFSLWMRPKPNLTDGITIEKPIGNIFVPFTNDSPRPPYSKSAIAIGSEIFLFGGPTDDNFEPSSAVRVHDCRNATWRNLPDMKMERSYASSCVLDDKIYVMGGCRAWFEDQSWFEMFDMKTQSWKTLPANPERNVRLGYTVRKIGVVEGNIYVKTDSHELKDWIYDVKESKWSVADWQLSARWSNSWCVVEDVMYCYDSSRYLWYDLESKAWRDVKGLEVLRKYRSLCTTGYPNCVVELVNYGGKLAIVWDKFERRGRSQTKNIWCAVVALKKWPGGVVWGKIEWFDVVLKVPKSYDFLRCLAVSV